MRKIFLGVDPWGLQFFLDDIPLYIGDMVEVQRNGVWIRGRFECWKEGNMLNQGHSGYFYTTYLRRCAKIPHLEIRQMRQFEYKLN